MPPPAPFAFPPAPPLANGTNTSVSGPGSVGVYYLDSNSVWQGPMKLIASDPAPGDSFGWSVAMSGDGSLLAIGAPLRTLRMQDQSLNSQTYLNCGAVYLFKWDAGMSRWVEVRRIQPTEPLNGLNFGASVSLSGDGMRLVVGASGFGYGNNMSNYYNHMPYGVGDRGKQGIVYVYSNATASNRGGENGEWLEETVATTEPLSEDRFGYQVRISRDGKTIVAGQRPNDGSDPPGAAVVFQLNATTARWDQASRLVPKDKTNPRAVAVSSNGTVVAVTALPKSSIFVLKNATTMEWQRNDLDIPKGTNTLGYATVSLSDDGTMALFGAPGDDNGKGATYTYRFNGTTWAQINRVRALDWMGYAGSIGEKMGMLPYFGLSGVQVSGDGRYAIAGAPQANVTGQSYYWKWV